MKIKLTNKDGVVLKTAQTYCEEDIVVAVENDNLIPEYVKKGIDILGVVGTFEGDGEVWEDPSYDTTAESSNIESGKTAYIDGRIVTGTNDMAALDSDFSISHTARELILNRNLNTKHDLSLVIRNSNNIKLRNGDIDISYEKGTVYADNLSPENIRKDVSILGVVGTLEETIAMDDASATAADILDGKTAYVNGELITGSIITNKDSSIVVEGSKVKVPGGYYADLVTKDLPETTLSKPSITVSATGEITATVNQAAGFIVESSESNTLQLENENLIPENILKGKTIFGIEGTAEGGALLKYTPVQVPNETGAYVERVYFNKNLDLETTCEIIRRVSTGGVNAYYPIYAGNKTIHLNYDTITGANTHAIGICENYVSTSTSNVTTYIFNSTDFVSTNGSNPDFTNDYMDINNTQSGKPAFGLGTYHTRNEDITDLIAITPFIGTSNELILTGEYSGNALTIDVEQVVTEDAEATIDMRPYIENKQIPFDLVLTNLGDTYTIAARKEIYKLFNKETFSISASTIN
jgi:hypothetical protein